MAPCQGAAPRWNDDGHDSRAVSRIGGGFDTPVHEESARIWLSPKGGHNLYFLQILFVTESEAHGAKGG